MNKYGFLIFLTAFASSISQILLNLSNRKKYNSKIREYLNIYVISSYGILALVLIANTYIMRFVDLKIAHALAASTYLFTMVLSRIIMKEPITKNKVIGNILIITGIIIFVL
ncbi:MAG: EamA family transporter [Lachnospiraceae bacterium]|nr:EamA family transporter [Lachnospiraceae bacterium]